MTDAVSDAKRAIEKLKKNNPKIDSSIKKHLRKLKDPDAKLHYCTYLFKDIIPYVPKEFIKKLFLDVVDTKKDVNKQLEYCKDVQKTLTTKIRVIQDIIKKEKEKTEICPKLDAYLSHINLTDECKAFMCKEGMNNKEKLMLISDDTWKELLSVTNRAQLNVQLSDLSALRTFSKWFKNNESQEIKITAEEFNVSMLHSGTEGKGYKPNNDFKYTSNIKDEGTSYKASYDKRSISNYGNRGYSTSGWGPKRSGGKYNPNYRGEQSVKYDNRSSKSTSYSYYNSRDKTNDADRSGNQIKQQSPWKNKTVHYSNVNTSWRPNSNYTTMDSSNSATNAEVVNDPTSTNVVNDTNLNMNTDKNTNLSGSVETVIEPDSVAEKSNHISETAVENEEKNINYSQKNPVVETMETTDEAKKIPKEESTLSNINDDKNKVSSLNKEETTERENEMKNIKETNVNVETANDPATVDNGDVKDQSTSKNTNDNKQITTYPCDQNKPIFRNIMLEEKQKQFKIMKCLYANAMKQIHCLYDSAFENKDKEYLDLISNQKCSYNIYSHCNCENWYFQPHVKCSVEECNKKIHKMCYYKMYSFYSGMTKSNATKLMDDSFITNGKTLEDDQFIYNFPIHENVKKLIVGKFYCADHLEAKNDDTNTMNMINIPDIRNYIDSFLSMKKNLFLKIRLSSYRTTQLSKRI